ncbi:MAG TPA: SDR family NAD(P)-dependent oxidoreductase [Patescibacteria group bacterium]|nr:SDR family NAD(P)-dependent oxidoreductase [Patescibacteria group bacterium]
MNLKDKIVVVTGATGGMGREIVKSLDNEGARLVLISKTESELRNLLETLKGKDNKYYVCDLSKESETVKVAKEISNDFNTIDVLINAAGIGIYKPLEELSLDEWNLSMEINLNSVFIMIKGLIKSLNNSKDSVVISLGSGMGVKPEPERSAYCTSKFALRGLMLTLAEEYERFKNPKFCLFTLGSVLTSFGPMTFEEKKQSMESGKGYLTPDWVAEKVTEVIKSDDIKTEYSFSSPDY